MKLSDETKQKLREIGERHNVSDEEIVRVMVDQAHRASLEMKVSPLDLHQRAKAGLKELDK